MKKYLLSLALVSLVHTCAYADEENPCGILHIQIANLTHKSCFLTKSNLIHGNFLSSPPTTILSNDSKKFDVAQTIFGPNIVLQYSCGDQQITFSSQQDLCFISAGKITGQVQTKTLNIDAYYNAESGSFIWNKPGIINWSLTN